MDLQIKEKRLKNERKLRVYPILGVGKNRESCPNMRMSVLVYTPYSSSPFPHLNIGGGNWEVHLAVGCSYFPSHRTCFKKFLSWNAFIKALKKNKIFPYFECDRHSSYSSYLVLAVIINQTNLPQEGEGYPLTQVWSFSALALGSELHPLSWQGCQILNTFICECMNTCSLATRSW